MEVTGSLGTVEVGKPAGLVLPDANPVEDITNTRGIRALVARRRLFERAALDELWAEVERASCVEPTVRLGKSPERLDPDEIRAFRPYLLDYCGL